MRSSRFRPSPALVIACLALGFSLAGTGYAAVKLPRNSVGTVHLKKNAVTAPKVKNGSLGLADFAPAARSKLVGPKGEQGDKGDTGAKGEKGDKGEVGAPGLSGYEIVTVSKNATGFFVGVTVPCPPGKKALAGGVSKNFGSAANGPVVSLSYPSGDGSAWNVTLQTVNSVSTNWTTTGYAVCAKVAP